MTAPEVDYGHLRAERAPNGRYYLAPCARPDGCRIFSITHQPNHSQPFLVTADCGWTCEAIQGEDPAVLRHSCASTGGPA